MRDLLLLAVQLIVTLAKLARRLLRSHWVLVVIDGQAVYRMFNQAIAGHAPPARISTDHDPLFRFHRWLANLRILEV